MIPSATLIQSLRTGFGDIFHVSDGVHINAVGEYAVGTLWYAYLTGKPVDSLSYRPAGVTDELESTIKELIPQVIQNPNQVIDCSK